MVRKVEKNIVRELTWAFKHLTFNMAMFWLHSLQLGQGLVARSDAHPNGIQEVAFPSASPAAFFHGDWWWNHFYSHSLPSGWLGQAMVLSSFQCRGVLLLLHMIGQGPAAGGLFFIFFISSILSSFCNASSLWRRLDILKYCGLGRYNPTVVVSYYWRRAR